MSEIYRMLGSEPEAELDHSARSAYAGRPSRPTGRKRRIRFGATIVTGTGLLLSVVFQLTTSEPSRQPLTATVQARAWEVLCIENRISEDTPYLVSPDDCEIT